MSVNQIELSPRHARQSLPFALLPDERLHFQTQSARQSFSVALKDPSAPRRVHIAVDAGHVFVTSLRFVYVAERGDVESFSFAWAAVPAIQFSHALKSPWFGPNYWLFLFYSPGDSTCDGFPKNEWFSGKITFSEGGLFDFVPVVDRAINDAVNNAGIDEELPRYSA